MKIEETKYGTVVTTDVVEAVGIYINTPSFEYDKKFGSYNMVIAMDVKEYDKGLGALFTEQLKTYRADLVKQNPKLKLQLNEVSPWQLEVDDEGDETGRYIIKFKQRARYVNGDGELIDRNLTIVDSVGGDASHIKATSGSKIRVKFTVVPYYTVATKSYGLSKWMTSVQFIDPVIYSGGNEFDEIDDGYVATPETVDTMAKTYNAPNIPDDDIDWEDEIDTEIDFE